MKTNVCVYIGPDNEPTAKLDDLDRPFSYVEPAKTIVNIWRDPETNDLHVSVHTPERVLLSMESEWWESSTETCHEQDTDIILHPAGEDALRENA